MAIGANPLTATGAPAGLATDANSLAALKASAGKTPDKAVKAAAREFEAMFLNQVLKSMRESLPKDGPFASSANDSYTQMLDRELSKSMAAKGTGLATMIEKQITRAAALKVDPAEAKAAAKKAADAAPTHSLKAPGAAHSLTGASAARAYALPARAASAAATATDKAAAAPAKPTSTEAQKSFLSKVVDMAKEPAAAVGLSPVFVAAQAALESGWGKFEIRNKDGSSAHNLFSIKAGGSWTGKTVDVTTTEYVNGSPVKRVEKFRAYESYAEGLADYVKLLASNSRYKAAVAQGQDAKGFSQALQKAGYATDPAYGQKLTRVIEKARAATGEA